MPTKAELQQRLTAARAEIKRLQQFRLDLARAQSEKHSSDMAHKGRIDAICQERDRLLSNLAQAAGDLALCRSEVAALNHKLHDAKRKLEAADHKSASSARDLPASKVEIAWLTAENDMLRRELAVK